MSKLFKLKEWMTVSETAVHLSSVIGEQVEQKDIFRLALDGHLNLSVNLVNHAQARIGLIVGADDVVYYDSPSLFTPEIVKRILLDGFDPDVEPDKIKILKSVMVSEGVYLNLDDDVEKVEGVWDLSMWGGEKLDVEHKYQMLTNGPEVTLETLEGVILRQGDRTCQLQESFDQNEFQEGSKANKDFIEKKIIEDGIEKEEALKIRENYMELRKNYLEKRLKKPKDSDYYPMGGLPADAVFIVKTEEILRFLSSLDENHKDSKSNLGTRERNTLLVLLATMCKQANFDYSQRGIAKAIEAATEEMGIRVSDDTIRGVLEQIPDALESRQK